MINNSYINEKTCGSPENARNRQLSQILETAPTHDTDYNKKGFAQKNINTNNTSDVGQILKKEYECVSHLAWERGCAKRITLFMFWRKSLTIM